MGGKIKSWMLVLVLVLVLYALAGAVARSEIIPASRKVDWSVAGVSGGVPTVTTIFTNIIPSGDAAIDTAAIQGALNACPSNQVVKLRNGTFYFDGTLDWVNVNDGVVLRGSGAKQTTIQFGSGNIYMRPGSFSEAALSVEVDLAADAVLGATTITLASMPIWVKTNHLYGIDEINDEVYATDDGQEGNSNYRKVVGNGERGANQLVRVTGISGNTITVELPLTWNFRTTNTAQLFQAGYDPTTAGPLRRCGIEDLKIEATYENSGVNMITMELADNCWLKNVYSYNTPGAIHVKPVFCYRVEIRDSFFYESHFFGPGQGYGVALYHATTYSRIENNIFRRTHAGVQINYGSPGNVVGYNYVFDDFADQPQAVGIGTHGTHPVMNLFEGNFVESKFLADFTHASGSHNTVSRNRIKGTSFGGVFDQTVVSIEKWNRAINVVGNVLGTVGLHTNYSIGVTADYTLFPAATNLAYVNCDVIPTIFKVGWYTGYGCGNDGTPDLPEVSDLIVHGNWDVVNEAVVWDGGIADHAVPDSLYLSGQPSWWTNGLPRTVAWPPIDPTTTTTENIEEITIPAKVRYETFWVPPTYRAVAPRGAIMKNGARGGGQF